MTNQYSKVLQNLKDDYNRKLALKKQVEQEVADYDAKISDIAKDIDVCEKTNIILSSISLDAKEVVVKFLENIVSSALSYISDGQYSFAIYFENTGKTTKCEFYVVEDVNGKISKQRPQDSCGGGFVDIIATTLRYAFLSLSSSPKLMGPIILDEPGKMISSEMSVKFGEFIKKLGDDTDRQTIMITHNNNLVNVADNVIEVIKGK